MKIKKKIMVSIMVAAEIKPSLQILPRRFLTILPVLRRTPQDWRGNGCAEPMTREERNLDMSSLWIPAWRQMSIWT